jgi:hypothetical protein
LSYVFSLYTFDRGPPTNDSEAAAILQDMWHAGRAPLDLIETGEALDVFVSAMKLDITVQVINV